MGKLVRDRIPELFGGNYYGMDEGQYKLELYKKLEEEVEELLENPTSLEEMADVAEVLSSILKVNNYSLRDLTAKMDAKRILRGGFEKRYYWERAK